MTNPLELEQKNECAPVAPVGPRVLFVRRGSVRKLGPMPVSYTTRATCPLDCALRDSVKGNGDGKGPCYAKTGLHTNSAWKRADNAPVTSWPAMLEAIAALPDGTLWRHNVAGDLPGDTETIDAPALRALVDANAGRKGFTYTHYKPAGANLEALRDANARGFTVNLSADDMQAADAKAATGLPTVVILPIECARPDARPMRTPGGRVIIVCPQTTGRVENCLKCGLCARMRPQIVGFPVHGTGKKRAEAIARGGDV